MKKIDIWDSVGIAGALVLWYGLYEWGHPLAYVATGAVLVAVSIVGSKSAARSNKG